MKSVEKSREVALMCDYGFKPSPVLLGEVPEQFREGLATGRLQLLARRNPTPNRWYIIETIQSSPTTAIWPVSDDLERLDGAPDLGLFESCDRSFELVDYGAAMNAYIPMASTSAFSDAGMSLWERYTFKMPLAAKVRDRRAKAEKSAQWFNRRANETPGGQGDLSDEAILLLAVVERRNAARLWMYRSVASAVLELVRAGFGEVNIEGYFAPHPDKVAGAQDECAKRNISLDWRKPEHILKREAAYWSNPRRRYTNFRGQRPELPYPIG